MRRARSSRVVAGARYLRARIDAARAASPSAEVEMTLLEHATEQVEEAGRLLEGVWNYHFDPQTNVIDVHISRLRQKVDKDFDSPLIHTVRGSGYMLALDG